MPAASEGFPAVLTSLWLRLITVSVIALLFAMTLLLPKSAGGWPLHLTTGEFIFELVVYVVFLALVGVTWATICAAATAPLLFRGGASRQRRAKVVTKIAVAAAAFVDFTLLAGVVASGTGLWGAWKAILYAGYFTGFAVLLLVPRWREQLVTSLDGYLEEKAARRNAIAIGVAFALLVGAEWTMAKTAAVSVMAGSPSRPSGPNVLLITFEALSADDMSLYGYRLPTTPHIDEFARKSSVFTNFYSSSTFTTPGIAAILTGLEPSESHVYRLRSPLPGDAASRSLPHWMRAGGYATGASVSNPFAYWLVEGIAPEFDRMAGLYYRNGGFLRLWNATGILHQRQPFGSRAEEFSDLESIWDFVPSFLERSNPRRFGRTKSEFPPAGNFAQGREVMDQLRDGYFLWVHIMAPHQPYLPDAPNLGRFLPSDEMRMPEEQTPDHGLTPHYAPSQQKLIDKARLRYDEFMADADQAFGDFLSGLESAGRLRNTAVIVAADHGESFEGGVYTHANSVQTRPEIHIPLIIRMPGQEQGRHIELAADQTALAPTILDIAGLPRPDKLPGRSLLPWLTGDGDGMAEGLAFTQYLGTNSKFKPISAGTVGVIDGRYQYVLELATGKGMLRPLSEANLANRDHSAENPVLAETLRKAIYSRFPDLPHRAE